MCADAATGTFQWHLPLAGVGVTLYIPFPPVVVDDMVVSFVSGKLIGLGLSAGKGLEEPFVRWEVHRPEKTRVSGVLQPVASGPAQDDGDLNWIAIWKGYREFGAVDLRTGRTIWQSDMSVYSDYQTAVVEGSELLTMGQTAESDCDALVMVDLAARREAWVCRFDGEVKDRAVAAFAPAGPVIYCALTDGSVAVVGRATGREVKTLDAELPARVHKLALVKGVLIAVGCDPATKFDAEKGNRTLVVGLDLDTGRTIWRWQCEDAWLWDDAISDDGVWVLRRTSVSKVAAADGRERTLRLPEGVRSCPPAASGAYLYCLDGNGHLICIEDKAARPAE